MEEKEFLEKMTEIMDTEVELSMDSVLKDIEEWDSLSYVAFLAFGATVAKEKIWPADVKAAKTLRDLYSLLMGDK
ncbi:hypothetical protein SAMN05216584_11220 [Selenomonas sp. WCT3]|uniref:hypothetical protein n=1 Tax=Selenomonas sp. WCT3 TaxID=3158785 RepID=UPI0008865374|nr:hypothetical protein SAMN05216584_11220 [Selenomonas ruminantium]